MERIINNKTIYNEVDFQNEIFSILEKFGASILVSKKMQESKNYKQHGKVSVYTHSIYVAYYAVSFALKSKKTVDFQSLVRGALLHDYFQYDWHIVGDGSHRLHGFRHPRRALKNAKEDYSLNKIEENIIDTHMFPLNLRFPKYREAWLVTLADKVTAWTEGLGLISEGMKKVVEPLINLKEGSALSPSAVYYKKAE